MPGMGWLDRFRQSPGAVSTDEVDEESKENATVLNNNMIFTSNKVPSSGSSRISQELVEEYRKISDLTQLDQITLSNVLNCLVERFQSEEYYTFAGSVLISLNPCLNMARTQFLDVQCMTKYKYDEDSYGTALEKLPPHVYSIGLRSLKNLHTVGNNQVIIVSGDSGAGKTTSTQQLIRYFTETNLSDVGSSTTISNLEKKIYFATVILESFGNASTIANPNSSRFGRLVQLSYDKKSRISGAEIKTYLLEKHRVAKGSCSERNFHIFYILLRGLETGLFKIEDISKDWTEDFDADLLNNLTEGLRESDTENMTHFYQALKVLNMTEEFQEIFRIVFAIMHLRTVKFTLKQDENASFSDNEHSFSDGIDQFTVSDWDSMNIACSIIGQHKSSLLEAFVVRKIMAGKRQSIFRNPCEREAECDERLQAFIILLYDKLFNHVLMKLNSVLQNNDNSMSSVQPSNSTPLHGFPTSTTLSLLDLYGFENLSENHLEQMCINYANERLQKVHISALKNYFEEQANVGETEFQFEEPLELNRVEMEIEKRIEELHHIFLFLNEECVLKRCTTDKNIFVRMAQETEADKFISCGRIADQCQFIVRHYATDVTYNFRGMPDKNKDYIPPEFGELLSCSTNPLIRSLFEQPKTNTLGSQNLVLTPIPRTPSNKNEREKTILKRFKTSVDELVKELRQDDNQDLHFIRCIRPNTDLLEGKVQPDVVEKQLYSCGIVDVIRIAGNGYPIRIRFSKFTKEFPLTLRALRVNLLNSQILVSVFCFGKSILKVGNSAIFMNEKAWKSLKNYEGFLADSNAKKIQRWIRDLTAIRVERDMVATSPISCISNDSVSMYFTPSMSPTFPKSPMSPIPGPFGDWRQNIDSFDSSCSMDCSSTIKSDHSLNSTIDTYIDSEDNRQAIEERLSSASNLLKMSSLVPVENVEAAPAKVTKPKAPPPNLYYGKGIVSRRPIHTLPIKLYTKKTALGNCHVPPQRLVANGLQDCFTDYGIITRLKSSD